MMKNNLLIIFILSFSCLVSAQTSLEWQRVSLEEKFKGKVEKTINKIIDAENYMVEIEIGFSDPGPPNFDDLTKVGMKVSDIKFDDSKGDYIAFSKVGLEVPVIEKYFNDNQQKLKELHRFNESYDLFKNIDEFKIQVWLDPSLSELEISNVKKLVKKLKFPLADIKPVVKFDTLDIEKKSEAIMDLGKKKDEISQKDIYNWLSRFGNAVGLILATLLFGIIAYMLLKKYEQILENERERDDADALAGEVQDEKEEENENTEEEENEELVVDPVAQENFERFQKFCDNSKSDAILMIKRWINIESSSTQLALKAIAQQLSDEDLVSLFQGLSDNERDKWKNFMDYFLTSEQISEANQFISEEVVRDMIGPSKIQDIELIDMLLTLSPEEGKQFVIQLPNQANILMNLLTPQFSGKILDLLDEGEAFKVINESLEFDYSEIKDNFVEFKKVLTNYKESVKKKPFNNKIIQMLPDFNPAKEGMLYNFLAQSGMRNEMIKAATEFIPSELIVSLPKGFLREVMQNYPMEKKVLLLSSVDIDLKESLMNSFAEKGSTSREMLELEFDNIDNDPVAQSRIKSKQDELWKEFVDFTREMVKLNEEFRSDIDLIILSWVEDLINGKPAKEESSLKQVA